MPGRFPAASTRTLSGEPQGLATLLESLVASKELQNGYLRYRDEQGERYLFVAEGRPHSAGVLVAGLFIGLPMKRFFGGMKAATEVELGFCDAPLLGCLTTLFGGDASVRIPAAWLTPTRLLDLLRDNGRDVTVVFHQGSLYALVPAPGGEPDRFYAAEETATSRESAAEAIATWAGGSTEGVVEVFEGLRGSPAEDAGKRFVEYLEMPERGPPDALVVRLGGRVVSRYELGKKEVTVGRGPENDLPLDNLSVSRSHARMVKQGDTLLVQDLGSENGLTFRGNKVTKAVLALGEELEIGRYTIVFSRGVGSLEELAAAAPRPARPDAALQATFFVQSGRPTPELEHRGRRIKLAGLLFTIGSGPSANLRVEGFLVAPLHARIGREGDGARIMKLGRWRKVLVNDRAVEGELPLKDGDVIRLAGEEIVFHAPAPIPAAKPAVARLGPKPR